MTLNGTYGENRSRSSDDKLTGSGSETSLSKTPVTDVKLEPIKRKVDDNPSKKTNDILNVPSENIKNRLSSASTKSKNSEENLFLPNSSSSGSNHSLSSHGSPLEIAPQIEDEAVIEEEADTKLVAKLSEDLDQAIQKATDNANMAFDGKLADYCSQVTGNVKMCSERIEDHRESLKMAQEDTNTLVETFKKTQMLESRLRNSLGFLDEKEDFNLFPEELRIPKQNKDRIVNTRQQPKVKSDDRKKLLATLKAIDNGESIDSVEETSQKPMSFMPEFFSDGIK